MCVTFSHKPVYSQDIIILNGWESTVCDINLILEVVDGDTKWEVKKDGPEQVWIE
jgi:hypothetical protein